MNKIPPETPVGGDLGYKGIEKLHPNAHIPRKKPRNKPRPEEDIEYNRCFSQRAVSGVVNLQLQMRFGA